MKNVAELAELANKLRKDIDRFKLEIDKHESFAERDPNCRTQIIKDLEAGRQDINQAIWIFHETRTSIERTKNA